MNINFKLILIVLSLNLMTSDCMALTLGVSPQIAINPIPGLGLSVEATAIAGLDAQTRALIEKMPENIRKQFILALIQAKPIIDRSVHEYLDHVNQIASNIIEEERCVIIGSSKVILLEFKEIYLGIENTPMTDLTNKYNKLSQIFTVNSTPQSFRINYIEFIARAEHEACGYTKNGAPWTYVHGLAKDATQRFNTWDRLNKKCNNAYECYKYLHTTVEKLLQSSNKSDLTNGGVNAMERFRSLPDINKLKPSKWEKLTNAKIPTIDYENHLIELFSIYDEVNINIALRHEREATDAKALDIVKSLKERFDKNYDEAINDYNNMNYTLHSMSLVLIKLNSAMEENKKILNELKNADEFALFDTTKKLISDLRSEIQSKNQELYLKDHKLYKEYREIEMNDPETGPVPVS